MNRLNRRELLAGTSALALSASLPGEMFSASDAGAARKIKRGVTFYSYQEEYYKHEVTVEDCFAEVASMGATGVQLIAEEMVPNYPNPPQSWVDGWQAMMATYKTEPTNIDTFVDVYVGGHRKMTTEEAAETLIGQIRLASRLGFKVMRPTTGPVEEPATEMIERALPVAEKLDVRIAPEVHAPIPLDGKYINAYLELIHRTGTKHMGFTVDFGIFCRRLPRVFIDYCTRHGAQKRVTDYVSKAFEDGASNEQIMAAVQKMDPSPADMQCAGFSFGYGPITNKPQDLARLMPYIYNIHGKFYEMTDELAEYSIAYDEIIPVLTKIGYQHSIDSEYEGQRWIQDYIITDSFEQVRRQHVMLRRLLGEI
jgi:Xylose isomerase-like TIM barrel